MKTLIIILITLTSLTSLGQSADTIIISSNTNNASSYGTCKSKTNHVKISVPPLRQYLSTDEGYKRLNSRKPGRWYWDSGHWQGMSIHYSGLVGGLDNLRTPFEAAWMGQSGKSIGVDLNLVDATIFSAGCFGIITGLGLEMNNFRFEQNVAVTNDQNGVISPDYTYDDAGIKLSKSKISTTYLNVPLLFEFQFGRRTAKGWNNGWVNFGVVGGLLLNGHAKVKSEELGIQKKHDQMKLSNFHYGFEASIGYSLVGIRVKYYPHSIFRPGAGPDVQQVNIGIIIGF